MITLREAEDCPYYTYYIHIDTNIIATREEFERDTTQEELEYANVKTASELFDIQLEDGTYYKIQKVLGEE